MVVWLLAGILVAVLFCSELGRLVLFLAAVLGALAGVGYVIWWGALIGWALLSR